MVIGKRWVWVGLCQWSFQCHFPVKNHLKLIDLLPKVWKTIVSMGKANNLLTARHWPTIDSPAEGSCQPSWQCSNLYAHPWPGVRHMHVCQRVTRAHRHILATVRDKFTAVKAANWQYHECLPDPQPCERREAHNPPTHLCPPL